MPNFFVLFTRGFWEISLCYTGHAEIVSSAIMPRLRRSLVFVEA